MNRDGVANQPGLWALEVDDRVGQRGLLLVSASGVRGRGPGPGRYRCVSDTDVDVSEVII